MKHTWISEYNTPHSWYGCAISGTYEMEDGTLWVGNGEYDSQINFCPWTGYEAKIKVKEEDFGKFIQLNFN